MKRILILFICLSGVLVGAESTPAAEAKKEKVRTVEEKVSVLEQQVYELSVLVQELRRELSAARSSSQAAAPNGGAEAAPAQQVATVAPAKPAAPADPSGFRAYWKEGIRMDTADEKVKLKVGGRFQQDWTFFLGDNRLGDEQLRDGTEFRRARLYFSGTIYERVEFKVQYDFAGGFAGFRDVWFGLKKLPVLGNFKGGHFKEPLGLEQLTSSKYVTFNERALTTVFTPGRNAGIQLSNTALDERITWAAGFFHDVDNFGIGTDDDGGWSTTGRFTGLPWYDEGGRKLLHLGVGYSHRSHQDGFIRYRQRLDIHQAPRAVDTGGIPANSEQVLGLESALVAGPFSAQGEYIWSFVDSPTLGDPTFSSFYVQGSFFLTGENRRYKNSAGSFDRTRPRSSFLDGEGGAGAWEVAARFSRLDLDDQGVDAGVLKSFAVAVNWYLNANTRVNWNYIFGDLDEVNVEQPELFSDNISGLTMRFQLDF